MKNNQLGLNNKDTLVVFTYSNTGFGHLRVTDALSHSIPEKINYLYFQADSKVVNFLHRFTSIHPIARFIFEWSQKGLQEDVFTAIYRYLLKISAPNLLNKFISVIKCVKTPVKKIVVIATHFSIAHQLTFIRRDIEKRLKCKLFIIVQVTDDSPQHIWYIPGVDLIFAPSKLTKDALIKYGKRANLKKTNIKVIPYPISEKLLKKLTKEKYEQKLEQYKYNINSKTNILIPVSGAAVGMKYFENFALNLLQKSNNFNISFVMKNAPNNQTYINKIKEIDGTYIISHKRSAKVVEAYELELQRKVYSFELTKPSEQAFKILISLDKIGGMILLFTKAIGRQEYDNLFFLKRHSLIPQDKMQKYLWDLAKENINLPTANKHALFKLAKKWRGLRLPNNPKESVNFIIWCLKNKIFLHMGKHNMSKDDDKLSELSPNGVNYFWKNVISFVRN